MYILIIPFQLFLIITRVIFKHNTCSHLSLAQDLN